MNNKVLSTERRKATALGMFEERNLEGDDEMGLPCGPMEPGAKWPFPKPPYSVQRPLFDEDADDSP